MTEGEVNYDAIPGKFSETSPFGYKGCTFADLHIPFDRLMPAVRRSTSTIDTVFEEALACKGGYQASAFPP